MPTPGIVELVIIAVIVAMMAATVVIPAAVIAIILRRRSDARGPSTPALQTLETRLANGEIDEAEYLRLRSVLQRG